MLPRNKLQLLRIPCEEEPIYEKRSNSARESRVCAPPVIEWLSCAEHYELTPMRRPKHQAMLSHTRLVANPSKFARMQVMAMRAWSPIALKAFVQIAKRLSIRSGAKTPRTVAKQIPRLSLVGVEMPLKAVSSGIES